MDDLTHQQAVEYGKDLARIYLEEKAKRRDLEIAYSKLEGALESMSDGFMVVDENLTVIEINRACADLFEYVPEDAIGHPLHNLLIGSDTQIFCESLQGSERRKLTAQLRVIVPLVRSLVIHAVPLPDGGWVLVLHDITWEERVNNMREEFLNLAAHELRTPLAGLIGFTSLLEQAAEKESFSEETWSLLKNILTSSERLRSTVSDLLDFTVSDSSNVDVRLVDLVDIIEDTVILLTKKAATHEVLVELDLPDEMMQVVGDAQMLSIAFGHLIENGIIYNKPSGTLTISGELTDDLCKIILTDTGVGITRKDLDYIFKPFFQVEEHTTRHSVGMGLGLSIARRTLTLHQGRLEGTSELGVGSTFMATLPRFTSNDMDGAKSEWHKIQRNLRHRSRKPDIDQQTQSLIAQLKHQLEVTQSQSLAYAKDLTKLYQLQRADAREQQAKDARINQTDRLALMGQLAAGVAHDLSNLIGPILGYAQIALRKRDTIDPTVAEVIERILNTSRRANVLLRQMVTLASGHSENAIELIDLNELITEMLFILEVKLNHADIVLQETYAADLPAISGSPIQISQVILNILINAIDAMPDGGTLTLETALAQDDGRPFLQLRVTDTGEGILPENISHIFDAFFTTKEKKSGTGLGLAVSKDIIDHHGGKILVDSTSGQGSTFTISLPAEE